MNRIERISSCLDVLQPLQIELADDSHLHAGHAGVRDDGGHYRLIIVSPQFVGKSTVARHRMIYSALGNMMKHEIHALSITAKTPDNN